MVGTRSGWSRSLHTGARIGLVIAVLILVFAAFRLWLPIDITGDHGAQFDCGSVLHPPSNPLQKASCGTLVDRERMTVIFSAIAALVVAAGSLYAFGPMDRAAAAPQPVGEASTPAPAA